MASQSRGSVKVLALRLNGSPGTGGPRATATDLRAAYQQVFHDPEHTSATIVPTR